MRLEVDKNRLPANTSVMLDSQLGVLQLAWHNSIRPSIIACIIDALQRLQLAKS